MNTFFNKGWWALVLGAALVAGCGGDSDNQVAAPDKPTMPIELSASALFSYIGNLIDGTSETSEPVDINGLTLAVDDAAEPTPLN